MRCDYRGLTVASFDRLEISLGQFYETGDVGVFGSIHARLRGVGMSSIACGYMLVTYYSMLLAWTLNAFFDSFGSGRRILIEIKAVPTPSYR